jgi:hypothetical protein
MVFKANCINEKPKANANSCAGQEKQGFCRIKKKKLGVPRGYFNKFRVENLAYIQNALCTDSFFFDRMVSVRAQLLGLKRWHAYPKINITACESHA